MKTKLFIVLFIVGVVIATSCKKDSVKTTGPTLTTTQLNDVSSKSTKIFGEMQSFMNKALLVAVDSGKMFEMPPQTTSSAITELSKVLQLKNAKDNYDWWGPDADGWYYRSWEGVYKYSEKIRCKDTVLTHIFETEYSGGDGSYSNVWETQFTKYTKNKKVLWKGYTDWKISSFGNNNISDVQWRFEFDDWDPQTGAGDYNWYWGAHSLGGGYEPYHRILNITATENVNFLGFEDDNTLHVKITWYDGSIEYWSFEYDTSWEPVEMPDNPCNGF